MDGVLSTSEGWSIYNNVISRLSVEIWMECYPHLKVGLYIIM